MMFLVDGNLESGCMILFEKGNTVTQNSLTEP